jgi:hypothetical protein
MTKTNEEAFKSNRKQLLILILLMETQVTKFSSLPTQSKLPPIKLKIMNVMKQYGK